MPAITQTDFLNSLFSLNPFIVALIILIWGWGNLFLFAIKTKCLNKFLKHPSFMVGDLIMLPLAGFLITSFYQQIENPMIIFTSANWWVYTTLIISLGLSLLNAYKSLFVWKSTSFHLLIIPHFFFYWFMTYVVINFIVKGLLQLLFISTPFLWIIFIGVLFSVSVHLILGIFRRKTFPVA